MTDGASGRAILVAVKHVPVGGAGLRLEGDHLTREGVSHGLDPINEVALEWALLAREAGIVERVVAVTLGPEDAIDSLRKALALGADEAVHVCDDALAGSGVRTTAEVLAAVARQVGAAALLTGYESMDGSSGAVPAAAAALLGWPLLSRVDSADLAGETITARRDLADGPETVSAELPVVMSMVEGHVAPRYPKLKDVLRTKATPATRFTAADLDVPAAATHETSLVEVPLPPKEPRVLDLDEGVSELFELLTVGGVRG
jgi:electron transfer flavoprotein beta subunit